MNTSDAEPRETPTIPPGGGMDRAAPIAGLRPDRSPMSRDNANRILGKLKSQDADFSDAVIRRALRATGDLA